MDDTQAILTTKQVLFNFSISREQLRRWTEKGLPRIEKGKFDLKAVIKFRDEFILGSSHDEMSRARLRREVAKARHQELITLEKEGTLISKELVSGWLRQIILEARAVLLQIPYRLMESLAIENDPRVIFSILKKEIYDALSRLSEGKKKVKREGIS